MSKFEDKYLVKFTPILPTFREWLNGRKLFSPRIFKQWQPLSERELEFLDWLMVNHYTEFDDGSDKYHLVQWANINQIKEVFPDIILNNLYKYLRYPIHKELFDRL